MHGDYIVDRWMVQAIKQICRELDAELTSYSDDWILEIRKGDATGRVFGYKFSLNNSASANIAQDKVGSYDVLREANISAVQHYLLRTKANESQYPPQWDEVVLKPLVGTSGHLVQAFSTKKSALAMVKESSVEAWAISPRLDITNETRFIILDGKVLLAYEKIPAASEGLTMFNLGRGATPRDVAPPPDMVALAINAQKALGLRLCAVDVIKTKSGERIILEVNDGIMMEYYSRYSHKNRVRSSAVYREIIQSMLSTSC